ARCAAWCSAFSARPSWWSWTAATSPHAAAATPRSPRASDPRPAGSERFGSLVVVDRLRLDHTLRRRVDELGDLRVGAAAVIGRDHLAVLRGVQVRARAE